MVGIQYCCITEGKNFLVVESPPAGEEPTLAATLRSVITTVPARTDPSALIQQTVEDDNQNYYYLATGDRVYACAASKAVRGRVAIAMLGQLHQATRHMSAAELKGQAPLLSRAIERANDPNSDPIAAVQVALEGAKSVMTTNVDKALRGVETVSAMAAKSEEMQKQAHAFEEHSQALKRKMCVRWSVAVVVVAFVAISIIVLASCGVNMSGCNGRTTSEG